MTEAEDVDVEEIVAAVIEYLDEEDFLKSVEEYESDTFHERTEEEDRTSELSPVDGADGREFY